MPCNSPPDHLANAHRAKKSLNKNAKRLLDWLTEKIAKDHRLVDDTARLCSAIRALGEKDFRNLMVEHIDSSEARELLGWWEEHKKYDEKYGR